MNLKLLPASALLLLLLTGCGLGTVTPIDTTVVMPAATKTSGVVMGGQQPVGGITLQLYTVGTAGYGSVAAPLGASFSTTPQGNFTLPTFTCPTAGALTFMVGTGGQPIAAVGPTPAVTNNNLALMIGLGACSMVGTNFIDMNEVTTVATVWALSPFMTGITSIGAPASSTLATLGLTNAFASINKVANTINGTVSGPSLPAGATLPIAQINTIADILEQCANSGGGTAADTTDGQTNGTGCGKLFYLTGGTSTTDTITAALYIAQHPSSNVAKLNSLRSSSPAFQPALSVNTPPTSWSIVISYTGGGLSSPQSVATDQSGNVWVANSGNSSVSEFNALGAAISTSTGFTSGGISTPYALAVDQTGNAWVANSGNDTITKLTPNGASATSYGSSTTLNVPKGIAIDAVGNIWVSNSAGASVSAFSSSGTAITGSPYTTTGIASPLAIAIDPK